jgi:hypothetical protein
LCAQERLDLNIGVGTAWDDASGAGIYNGTSAYAYSACTPASGDVSCLATPKLTGANLGFGGAVMFNKHFGAGMEYLFQPARRDYGPFEYRQAFYDFNGIYEPVSNKHYALQLSGGIGRAHTGFSYTSSGCVAGVVCSSSTQSVGSSNHFATHVGVGLQIYLTQHIFVRPQFDWRYVPNLTQQFNSNSVPAATLWVGYSMGHGN